MPTSTSDIPIIDFAGWKEGSTLKERNAIATQLAEACQRVGFVYIVNHGVESELLRQAFGWTKQLFDLKDEKKMLAPHPDGSAVHRGYSWPGLEKVSQVLSDGGDPSIADKLRAVTDCKESYEIGSEDDQSQPNVWLPEEILPGFRDFMNAFYWRCNTTAWNILRAISLGLGLEEDFLLNFHSGHNNQLRLLHYPPVAASALESNSAARMPAHTDWGSITMLFQDDCGGLEVENPHEPGHFIRARPVKDALIMNVGDLLQRWSNDKLKSTLHRVVAPPLQDRYTGEGRMTRARYSIPFFVSPNVDAVIECLSPCVDSGHPVKYGPIIQDEYRLMRAKVQYPDRSERAPLSV